MPKNMHERIRSQMGVHTNTLPLLNHFRGSRIPISKTEGNPEGNRIPAIPTDIIFQKCMFRKLVFIIE